VARRRVLLQGNRDLAADCEEAMKEAYEVARRLEQHGFLLVKHLSRFHKNKNRNDKNKNEWDIFS
jgi:hypothetical protein